jgi:hypothetical protein
VGGVAPAAPTSGAGPKLRQTGMRRRGRGCGWCDLDELVGVSGGTTSALGISRIQELERGSRGIEGWQCPCFLRPISTQRLLHVLLLPALEEQRRARGEARARPLAARGAARRGCLPSVGATSQPLMIGEAGEGRSDPASLRPGHGGGLPLSLSVWVTTAATMGHEGHNSGGEGGNARQLGWWVCARTPRHSGTRAVFSFHSKVNTVNPSSHNRGRGSLRFEIIGGKITKLKNRGKITIRVHSRGKITNPPCSYIFNNHLNVNAYYFITFPKCKKLLCKYVTAGAPLIYLIK